MSLPNLVPRGDGTGSLGRPLKRWSTVYAISASFNDATITGSFYGTFDGDGSRLSGIVASVVQPVFLDFNTSSVAPPYREGRVYWDNEQNTLTLMNNQPDVRLQIGEELYTRVINKSGNIILNGTPVKISGSFNQRAAIYPAQSEYQSFDVIGASANERFLGVATHDIADNAEGFVTTFGIVGSVDTSMYSQGAVLYVSQSAGNLTSQLPDVGYDVLTVGYVLVSNAVDGKILVSPSYATRFQDILRVSSSREPINGETWVYNNRGYFELSSIIATSSAIDPSITKLDIPSGIVTKTTRVTGSSYVIQQDDYRIGVLYTQTGSGNIYMPLISDVPYQEFKLKDEGGNASQYNIHLISTNNELIDGQVTQSLISNYAAITIYNNGSDKWFIE